MNTNIARIERPTIRKDERWAPESWQLVEVAEDATNAERHVVWQWNRIIRWTMKKPKSVLAKYIAILLFRRLNDRHKLRRIKNGRGDLHALTGEILRALKASEAKHKRDRRKGWEAMDSSSGFPAMRTEMERLYLLGKRQGWQARKYKEQLLARNHDVPLRTVSNWLKKLHAGEPLTK